jgi:glycosyltransferase involved in cell wall biosynthesis
MYLTTLTKKMSEFEPTVEFLVLESGQYPLQELNALPNVARVECRGVPTARAGRIVYQNTILPLYLRAIGADAFLATCNVLPLGCPLPTVVVVQSLQYFDYRQAFGTVRGAYLRAAVKHAGRHAGAMICVSESARRDLMRLTGLNGERVKVVRHGVSPVISGYRGVVEPASPPYVLCVATLYQYKNLERLIQAFKSFKMSTAAPHRLRIIGGAGDMSIDELVLFSRRAGVGDQVDLIGPVLHHQMAIEYARASAFVYPSLAETFGLPPLEAMTIGVPVVASRVGPIPEVVGNAAELVDPLSIEDIARGIKRVLLDSGRSRALVQLGFKRASEFSWDEAARRTIAVVRSVLS